MKWPFVLPNQLIVGNPEASVALLCGWTRREFVRDRLKLFDPKVMDKVAAIGQLYTQERGVDALVRNLLANPNIRHLVLSGSDKTGAMAAVLQLFGDAELIDGGDYTLVSGTKVKIRKDIPLRILRSLAASITCYDIGHGSFFDEAVLTMIKAIEATVCEPHSKPKHFPPPEADVEALPAPDNAHPIRAKTIPEAYLELIYQIMTFGRRVQTHYDQDTTELMNLQVVVTDHDPYSTDLPSFIPFDKEHLLEYRKGLMSADAPPDGVTYTYGNMMRGYFGVDQIEKVVTKLTKNWGTRSAVISLWDPKASTKGSPCLNHVWWRIRDDKLHSTWTIRSNDMLCGWAENAYGFRYVHEQVRCMILKQMGRFCDSKELVLGDMVINSQSAHIYSDGWDHALQMVKEHRKAKDWWDEKGQWTFRRVGNSPGPDLIEAQLLDPEGFEVVTLTGSGQYIYRRMTQERLVSDVGHALWLGFQLGKMEEGEEEEQTNQVPWKKPYSHYYTDGPQALALFGVAGTKFLVKPTGDSGSTSGRSRFRVECLTCEVVLHHNTTGPRSRILSHLKRQHGFEGTLEYRED